MSNEERIYTIKLPEEKFKTVRNCLADYERMARQKVMRKIERDEHIPLEVLDLLATLSEVNDLIFEERLKVERLNGVSTRKQC